VDDHARLALAELVREVVSRDLDELHARLEALERQVAEGSVFAHREHLAQRRRAVVALRLTGLSISAVAERLGLGRSTVERDLQVTPHTAPDYVVGLDGKRQPSRRNGRC
jgi:DNA-binding NarL/FixJ family response regulator